MSVVLPKSHRLAGASTLTLEELRLERFVLCAGGLGPDIKDHLARRTLKWAGEPRIQLHRVGQCNLIDMVARGFGVTIVVGPLPRTETSGVALVPLAGRNVIALHAIWMESNPNPALKGLLNIVRGYRQSGPAT
jgi:DNA-binding transcriptional LysR family regulator